MPAAWALRASVIIVNFNGREALLRCLASVQADLPADCEIVVVDNASSDGSIQAVRDGFPDVVLVENTVNGGFGAGANSGVLCARGRSLVFLNPDTLARPGWLDALLRPVEGSGSIGLATSRILLASDPDRLNTCGNSVHLSGLTLCRGMGRPSATYQEPEEVNAVSGAAFSIRRELFELLGGFDETFFLYLEDTDLSLRARLAGWRTFYEPSSIVLHDYALSLAPQKLFFQERNRHVMLLKILRWPTLLALLPALLAAEMLMWGFLLVSNPAAGGSKLRAYLWFPLHWRGLLRNRKAVQLTRRERDRALVRSLAFRLDFQQAVKGAAAHAVHAVFDPLFFALKTLALTVVWW